MCRSMLPVHTGRTFCTTEIKSQIKQNKKKYLIVISPMLVAVFFCILSPANNYFRDALPFIFPMPLVVMYLLNLKKIEKVK